mgnify:FL=1
MKNMNKVTGPDGKVTYVDLSRPSDGEATSGPDVQAFEEFARTTRIFSAEEQVRLRAKLVPKLTCGDRLQ